MTCKDNTLQLFRSKDEQIPFKMKIDGVYVDFQNKEVEFLIGENWTTDRNESGTGIVFYQSITSAISTETILFVISWSTELPKDTYQYRVKITEVWQEPQRTPLYNVIVNV